MAALGQALWRAVAHAMAAECCVNLDWEKLRLFEVAAEAERLYGGGGGCA
jgi:hypothetical protein